MWRWLKVGGGDRVTVSNDNVVFEDVRKGLKGRKLETGEHIRAYHHRDDQ